MEYYKDIVTPMKKLYVSMCLEIERLEGIFKDATAGGIVWKERKKKGHSQNKKKLGNICRYAYYQYYDKRKQSGKRKVQRYIRKNELGWAISLVNSRRNKWKRLAELKKEIKKVIKGLLVFSVKVEDVNWEIKARKLKKELKKVRKKPFKERCRYMTINGELVRSRAERKIANELFHAGVVYKYERPVWKNNVKVLPDFVVEINGKTYIWEHLGMLDIPEYAEKWERKKRFYAKIGFIEGKNLIVTTEKNIDSLSLARIIEMLKER